MKWIIILCVIGICLNPCHGQNEKRVISGKSKPQKFNIKPEYKPGGDPPILYAHINFSDENNNLILEANEQALITLDITNGGNGTAQELQVIITDSISDPNIMIGNVNTIPYLQPGKTRKISIPLKAGMGIISARHKLDINISEHNGYDMDPVYLRFSTMKFREPSLAFSGISIVDLGEGTTAIKQDGKLQAGEKVNVKVSVQNIGQNVSRNTKYNIKCNDKNINLFDGSGDLGDLGIGEVKEFHIKISPNKRVTTKGNLPLYLSLTNDGHYGELTEVSLGIALDQKPPLAEFLDVPPDYEKIEKQQPKWEVSSSQMLATVGNDIDIKQVPPSKMHRNDAMAVVIGVERYKNTYPAPYAENDADLMEKYFKTVLGINNVLIFKSTDVISHFFDDLFNPYYGTLPKFISKGKTDLFVYYSGHGIPLKVNDSDSTNIYLLPSDGHIQAIKDQGYDLNKFYKNLDNLGARSVTVFMDACFSGVSRSSDIYKAENQLAMYGEGYAVINPTVEQPWEKNHRFSVFASCDYNQNSFANDRSETGLFTYYLCAGLQGKADEEGDHNKQITSGELSRYIIEHVKEMSVKIRSLQTPQFHGDENMVITEY